MEVQTPPQFKQYGIKQYPSERRYFSKWNSFIPIHKIHCTGSSDDDDDDDGGIYQFYNGRVIVTRGRIQSTTSMGKLTISCLRDPSSPLYETIQVKLLNLSKSTPKFNINHINNINNNNSNVNKKDDLYLPIPPPPNQDECLRSSHLFVGVFKNRYLFRMILDWIAKSSNCYIDQGMLKTWGRLPRETLVEIQAVVEANLHNLNRTNSITKRSIELTITAFKVVSQPINSDYCMKQSNLIIFPPQPSLKHQQLQDNTSTNNNRPAINSDSNKNNNPTFWYPILDNETISLGKHFETYCNRYPLHQATLRLKSSLEWFVYQSLVNDGFIEVHTPKLSTVVPFKMEAAFTVRNYPPVETNNDNDIYMMIDPTQYHMLMVGVFDKVFETVQQSFFCNNQTRRYLNSTCIYISSSTIHNDMQEILDSCKLLLTNCITHIIQSPFYKQITNIRNGENDSPPSPVNRDQCFIKDPDSSHGSGILTMTIRQLIEFLIKNNETGFTCYGDTSTIQALKEGEPVTYYSSFISKTLLRYFGVKLAIIVDEIAYYQEFEGGKRVLAPSQSMACSDSQTGDSKLFWILLNGCVVGGGCQRLTDHETIEQRLVATKGGILPTSTSKIVENFKYGNPPNGGYHINYDVLISSMSLLQYSGKFHFHGNLNYDNRYKDRY